MNKKKIVCCLAVAAFCCSLSFLYVHAIVEKPMVVIIPSYNNQKWVENNLRSVFSQNYENYRVIYIDDYSTDDTYESVQKLVEKYEQQNRVTVIHNDIRRGAMANWYTTIHSCRDEEIVVQLDGDDWLAHENVLSYLNKIYSEKDIWLTYGQFVEYPSGVIGYAYSKQFSDEVIRSNAFRKVGQLPISHLRTCYAWLFKAIKLEDVLYQGEFYKMTCDKVIMAACIEMAAKHHYCVPEVLYVYNTSNQISNHRVNANLQHSLAWYVLSLPPYKPLENPVKIEEFDECDQVSLLYICSNPLSKDVLDKLSDFKHQFSEIVVLVPFDKNQENLEIDPDIYVVHYKESFLQEAIQSSLRQVKNRFVLLGNDHTDIMLLDINKCVRLLKKTQTDVIFGIYNNKEISELCVNGKLPRISIEYPAYVMDMHYLKYDKDLPVIGGAIWRKDAVINLLECSTESNKELTSGLNRELAQRKKLVLLYLLMGGL
jgi:glycosyltransferase involved in cell wall biosynthesis